jgi:bifunctional DNA-binding transcriptional regulator/antitoxin component of YhaV-PrlF toxin-antitoxin module
MGVDPRQMAKLTKGLPSKSAKMRALAAAGYARADIARFLRTRYQFVRNVLVREDARRAKQARGASAVASAEDLKPTKVRLGPDGRVVIPAAFRDALALKDGDVMIASLEDGEMRLATMAAVARRVQALIRKFVPEGVSLSDELIAERRQEAAREEQDG